MSALTDLERRIEVTERNLAGHFHIDTGKNQLAIMKGIAYLIEKEEQREKAKETLPRDPLRSK